jgi:hypothetical protein
MKDTVIIMTAEEMEARIKAIVGRLEGIANDRVSRRQHIEKRWINDLRQYYGRYDQETENKLKMTTGASRLFVNLTRAKTNAMSARLIDILFPTDDKNWGISPTPVPELAKAAEQAVADAAKAEAEAIAAAEAQDPAAPQMQDAAVAAKTYAEEFQAIMDEARARCDAMSSEIDDILKECRYEAMARDVIEQMCQIGTGVCKGPVLSDNARRVWKNVDGEFRLVEKPDATPAYYHVDVWSFFPDPDVPRIEDSEGVLVRHLMNEKKMRKLARGTGFSREAIARLLKQKSRDTAPQYLLDLRSIIDDGSADLTAPFWHVWEYNGPLSADDIKTLARATGDHATCDEMDDVDPLAEINVVVWFCQGEVLKFSIYPLDSGECLYSVSNLERDHSSIFGFGVPAIMRDDQKALNAAWRMMMDNGGLSTGPQVVIDKEQVEPVDGNWEIAPRKVWERKKSTAARAPVFETYSIDSRQAELANIISLARQQIDEVTAIPQIATGEQGTGVTRTAQGMALLMNSANVVFRRTVKSFDDDFTVPNVRRLYDWLMQFSKKEEIKGDYNVDARGSSVLLVREMQSQNLLTLALQFGAHPVYGPALRKMEMIRGVFRAYMLPQEEYLVAESEYEAAIATMSQQAPDPNAEAAAAFDAKKLELMEMEISLKAGQANQENETKLIISENEREIAMMRVAAEMNLTLDQLEMRLAESAKDRRSKERIFAAEAAMTETHGKGGGGYL